jgi:transposase
MDCIGFDLGKVASQICVITEDGELIERRIKTDRENLTKLFGGRAPARVLLETGTESEWVARHLEGLGHEVVVADTNFAAMYATRSRRVKTDKRDARTLAEACKLGAYRPAHRASDRRRHTRAMLAVREVMVRTRAKYITLICSLLRRDGFRVSTGASRYFLLRLARLELPELLAVEVAPLVSLLRELNERIRGLDAELAKEAEEDAVVSRLRSVPGVGVITATSFVAALDEAERFPSAKQARAYLGLVPSERSSGEKQRRGRISKAGPSRVRYVLVEAAWVILRRRDAATTGLHDWATRVRQRRGACVAAVALARKLAGILYAMWRDGTRFEDRGVSAAEVAAVAAA